MMTTSLIAASWKSAAQSSLPKPLPWREATSANGAIALAARRA